MTLTGNQLIAGVWETGAGGEFSGFNPTDGQALQPAFTIASSTQTDRALQAAKAAARTFRNTSLEQRGVFLRLCADKIMALGEALLEQVTLETGYPRARGEMERGRTCNQLRMFADYIQTGAHLDARIDTALPDRQPMPRPDLRHINQALGPVAVFGASNFPLAFSVAGGDTASALAAGCPVIVKGHPSHPGTCELIAQAIASAVAEAGLPGGVFSMLMDRSHAVGSQLVKAPEITTVCFTGSFNGGTALAKLAAERPDPIPVFAEMGSVNPVYLLPEALAANAAGIAKNYFASFTLGGGQFCVKPGFVIAEDGEHLQAFIDQAAQSVKDAPAQVLLNKGICGAFDDGIGRYREFEGVEAIATGAATDDGQGYGAQVHLFATSADYLLEHPQLQEETFGPVSIIVKCRSREQMLAVSRSLGGQLTATVQCTATEFTDDPDLFSELSEAAGRLVVNGFPTGVEVCHAMAHGGPFPATTDARFTSVGSNAIRRFLRPLCLQNCPGEVLPEALKDHNPLGLMRLVNGEPTRDPIG